MAEANFRNDQSLDPGDVLKSLDLLKKLSMLTRYRATYEKNISINVHQVSIPALGLSQVRCYGTFNNSGENYKKDAILMVSYDESGIAFILPPELPRTPGKTKVVQNLDDSDPPTLGQDYLRFNQSAFNSFFDEADDPNA